MNLCPNLQRALAPTFADRKGVEGVEAVAQQELRQRSVIENAAGVRHDADDDLAAKIILFLP